MGRMTGNGILLRASVGLAAMVLLPFVACGLFLSELRQRIHCCASCESACCSNPDHMTAPTPHHDAAAMLKTVPALTCCVALLVLTGVGACDPNIIPDCPAILFALVAISSVIGVIVLFSVAYRSNVSSHMMASTVHGFRFDHHTVAALRSYVPEQWVPSWPRYVIPDNR